MNKKMTIIINIIIKKNYNNLNKIINKNLFMKFINKINLVRIWKKSLRIFKILVFAIVKKI